MSSGKPQNEDGTSLAARRARLRGSLAKAAPASDPFPPTEPKSDSAQGSSPETTSVTHPNPWESSSQAPLPIDAWGTPETESPAAQPPQTDILPDSPSPQPSLAESAQSASSLEDNSTAPPTESESRVSPPAAKRGKHAAPPPEPEPLTLSAAPPPVTVQPSPIFPDAALEFLSNIDQAMNACATNLASLQKLASEQTEVLKGLTETLQNQTLFEIGLNLNSLTESLSTALEPMKAAGELIPAMDQLLAALENRERGRGQEKLSADELVTSLSDQLSSGTIDPWTFKCAYMAVFPADHPADLLHRLVELLGTQRLSGDLFRAAYEAVQAAEPTAKATAAQPGTTGTGTTSAVVEEEIKAQLDGLAKGNDELRKRLDEREDEFQQLLAAKEQELQEAQELLDSRHSEFNTRYEEVAEALNRREEEYRSALQNKDTELTEKELELNMLRSQMEELRSQTEEMVKDLQQQFADIKVAKEAAVQSESLPAKPASSQPGFFDSTPSAKTPSLFDTAPQPFSADPFSPAAQPEEPAQPADQPAQPAPPQAIPATPQAIPSQPATQALQQQQTQSLPTLQATKGAGAAPAIPFTSGSGSYGSGVRAQVFEVIVRQALAGAPWREICAGPMQVNNITPDEVETEVKRRQAMLNK